MRFRNIRKWNDPIELRGLLYFAQRFEELTFEYSLDSYRAPAVSLPFLVQEAIDQLEFATATGLGSASIPHLLKEISSRFSASPIAKELTDFSFAEYTAGDQQNMKQLKASLHVLFGELQPRAYCLAGFKLLKEYCSKNEKAKIDLVAKEVSAILDNIGVSKQHQYRSTVSHFFSGKKISSADSLDEFLRVVFPHTHGFETTLKVRGLIKSIPAELRKSFKLSINEEIPKNCIDPSTVNFRKKSDDEQYVTVTEIKATNPFTALEKSKNRIEQLFNLFGLFHHKLSYEISDEGVALQQCCAKETGAYRIQSDLMQFVADNRPQAAAEKLKGFLKEIEFPKGDDRHKFFQTVELHGMSASSKSKENQLLNIWSCMETFTPSRHDRKIIDSVTVGLMPCLGLTYYQRIIKRTSDDLVRWKPNILSQIGLKPIAGVQVENERLIFNLLVSADLESNLEDLLTRCGNFELLRYRIYSLAKLFRSQKNIQKRLADHQERVEWQLRRIYRARNEIIHRGNSPHYTDSLVINAHDYFDQSFFCICDFLSGSNAQDSLQGAFDLARMSFEKYQSNISGLPQRTTVDQYDQIFWTPKKAPKKSEFFEPKP